MLTTMAARDGRRHVAMWGLRRKRRFAYGQFRQRSLGRTSKGLLPCRSVARFAAVTPESRGKAVVLTGNRCRDAPSKAPSPARKARKAPVTLPATPRKDCTHLSTTFPAHPAGSPALRCDRALRELRVLPFPSSVRRDRTPSAHARTESCERDGSVRIHKVPALQSIPALP